MVCWVPFVHWIGWLLLQLFCTHYSQVYLTSYFSTAGAIRRQPADTNRPPKRAEEAAHENPTKRVRTVTDWPALFTLATRDTSIFDEHVVNVQDTDPFGQRVPTQRIYVRECYRALCPYIFELLGKKMKLVLTGSPGIGKSLFGLLLIIEFVRRVMSGLLSEVLQGINHILYEHVRLEGSEPSYYIIDIECKSIKFAIERRDIVSYINSKETLLVKDGACNEYDHKCPSVWISSPRPKSLRKYIEESNVRRLCVPPIETDEIVACFLAGCAPHNLFELQECGSEHPARVAMNEAFSQFGDDDENACVSRQIAAINRWAADLGPCVRRVFNPAIFYKKQQAALSELCDEDYRTILNIADHGDSTGDRFKVTHALLTMCVRAPFVEYVLAPASKAILKKIWNLKREEDMGRARELMGRLEGARLGLIYEPYCHEIICDESGYKATARCLVGRRPGETKEWDFGALRRCAVSAGDFGSHSPMDGEYYVPDDPTFPVVDAWTTKGMFQMTVASTHPIQSGAKLFKALRDKKVPGVIFFVVPQRLYAEFPAQELVLGDGKKPDHGSVPRNGWNELEQWVVGLGSFAAARE
jgi:hypothetical protein